MIPCSFAAYFDKVKASNRITIHKVTCKHHKSHEANDDEWFYNITYSSIRFFAELIGKCHDLVVHDCRVCEPQLTISS